MINVCKTRHLMEGFVEIGLSRLYPVRAVDRQLPALGRRWQRQVSAVKTCGGSQSGFEARAVENDPIPSIL